MNSVKETGEREKEITGIDEQRVIGNITRNDNEGESKQQ